MPKDIFSQKLLVGISIDTFAGENSYWRRNPLFIPLELLLSTPWPSRQAQAVI
jgi:hypothetical protein